jgi:hypothetical protein
MLPIPSKLAAMLLGSSGFLATPDRYRSAALVGFLIYHLEIEL